MFGAYTAAAAGVYCLLGAYFVYLAHRLPRRPVSDPPDWGRVTDTRIPTARGGFLEVWRVAPDGPSRGVVVLAHGWSRNRDRMVSRARIFSRLGFTVVMHSARDHGGSSPYTFMNALRFAEDIEAVMAWVGEPLLLYGHSAGAAGAIIAAHRQPDRIRMLFLEGCYARTRRALASLYRSSHRVIGPLFAPVMVLWMDIFHRFRLDRVSPVELAGNLDLPVMIIHGEKDQNFPLQDARVLQAGFPPGRAELFAARGADHSSATLDPDFPRALEDFINRHSGMQPGAEGGLAETQRVSCAFACRPAAKLHRFEDRNLQENVPCRKKMPKHI